MGYCTDYVLSISYIGLNNEEDESRIVSDIILDQLNMVIEKMDIFEDGFDDEWYLYGAKWYDHDYDMLKLSKQFPELLFTLNGHGEEPEDMWYTYYHNGMLQYCPAIITYDDFSRKKLEIKRDKLGNDICQSNK